MRCCGLRKAISTRWSMSGSPRTSSPRWREQSRRSTRRSSNARAAIVRRDCSPTSMIGCNHAIHLASSTKWSPNSSADCSLAAPAVSTFTPIHVTRWKAPRRGTAARSHRRCMPTTAGDYAAAGPIRSAKTRSTLSARMSIRRPEADIAAFRSWRMARRSDYCISNSAARASQ